MSMLLGSAILAMLAFGADQAQSFSEPTLSELDADLVFTATVHFDAIRFDETSTPTVRFSGTLFDKTEWSAERINLPAAIQPGVTYRNAGVKLRILATFKDPEAFVKAVEPETAEAQNAAAVKKAGGQRP